jgi:hypothetical protein
VTILPVTTTPPAAPAGKILIGIPFDFGPDGATFEPPVTITLNYDLTTLPEGTTADDLVIVYYDTATGTWTELTDIVIDPVTGTISGQASHFTLFNVMSSPKAVVPEPEPEPVPVPQPEPEPVPQPEPEPVPQPTPEPVPTGGLSGWMFWIIFGGAVIIIAVIVIVIVIRRRS